MPRLSVVLPTRNRPGLLKIAVQTLLRQTFEDWELVLSDNSTNEESRAMMEEFEDPRIRYFRPDDLSMCDNWEFAASKAEGEYLCLLEDKQAFKFHALARINDVLEQTRAEVLRWQWDSLDPYGLGNRVRRAGARGGVHALTADKCLESLVDGTYLDAKHRLPIAHYSAVHRDVLKRIRAGAIGCLFPPVSPDYTFAIQVLNFADEVTYIDEGLVCFSDTSVSNGLSTRMKANLGNSFAASVGGDQVFYEHVPVKSRTIEGSIHNDYVNLRNQLGGRLGAHPPNWVNYFVACHDAIQSSIEMGVDMADEETEWQRALGEQVPEVQQGVRQRVVKAAARRVSLGRRFRKSRPVLQFSRGAKSLINGHLLRREDWRFSHILQYLEHEASKN